MNEPWASNANRSKEWISPSVSFYRIYAGVWLKVFFLFLIAEGLVFIFSNSTRRDSMAEKGWLMLFLPALLAGLALFQTWFSGGVYINRLTVLDQTVLIDYRFRAKCKSVQIPLSQIQAQVQPAGKGSLTLHLSWLEQNRRKRLVQTYFDYWNEKRMQEVVQEIKFRQDAMKS